VRSTSKGFRYAVLLLVGVAAASAQSVSEKASPAASTAATAYLNQVLDLMQKDALHSSEIDWPAVRREALKRAEGAQSTVDTYPAIYYALTQLKEHHSFLRLPDTLSEADKKRSDTAFKEIVGPFIKQFPKPPDSPFRDRTQPTGHLLRIGDHTVAYVVIPQCIGKHSKWEDNLPDFQRFADSLHGIAAGLETSHPLGWIIDLRGNVGGNMWPMLAGIGLVLGEGTLGSFLSPDGTETPWFYHDGKAGTGSGDSESVSSTEANPPLKLPDLAPVAVLIDSGTVSSGEAVTISFAGRPRERSFGTHTFGLSTSNDMLPLPDGASLFLNTAIEADRLHRKYPDGIEPDEAFPEPVTQPAEDSDPVLKAAEQWLLTKTP
jgi:carboxyl-terminal processing protease